MKIELNNEEVKFIMNCVDDVIVDGKYKDWIPSFSDERVLTLFEKFRVINNE